MEDFGYLKYEEQSKTSVIVKKALIIGAILLSTLCFVYITISAYYFVHHEEDSNIKIIKSPKLPIKIKNDMNGNIVIKDMDKAVYENIVGGKKESLKNQDINIIKSPQSPIPPLDHYSNKTKENVIKHSRIINEPRDLEEVITYDIAANSKNSNQLQSSNIIDITNEDIDLSRANGPLNRVQIAAMNSYQSAHNYWLRLKKSHSKLFSNDLKPFIKKVNLGKKGVFYRLQIGNFSNQIEAENFCIEFINKTQKNKADCIIVE